MTPLIVRIHRAGDPPLYPELADRVRPGTLTTVIGLEGGTVTGKPSVMFLIEDGETIIAAETTYALLHAAVAAFRGAFGDPQ